MHPKKSDACMDVSLCNRLFTTKIVEEILLSLSQDITLYSEEQLLLLPMTMKEDIFSIHESIAGFT